jgi:HemY protein
MRGVFWFILLFAVAVLAATTLGANDGIVTVAWRGWRADLSLNLLVVLLVVAYLALAALLRGLEALLKLPQRASEWRRLQRERAAHRGLREALIELNAARYGRARKAAEHTLAILDESMEDVPDAVNLAVAARLVVADSVHRLQDRERRDLLLEQTLTQADAAGLRVAADGARLKAAEWALDDRDAERALKWLEALPPGVARRTQALRLRLRATRLARQPLEALHTARMLAKHQAFTADAARGLLRSLASQVLDAAHDIEQLRQQWQALDGADRRDPHVAAHAARCAARMGAAADARLWLRPFWERLADLLPDDRAPIALTLGEVLEGVGPDWLPPTERALHDLPQDSAVAAAGGILLAMRELWGKAVRPLEQAARATDLDPHLRRRAWQLLSEAARGAGDTERAQSCEAQARALY